jgi:hypothetical protein
MWYCQGFSSSLPKQHVDGWHCKIVLQRSFTMEATGRDGVLAGVDAAVIVTV